MKLNKERQKFFNEGLKELPKEFVDNYKDQKGANGETLSYDEAEVWKRVLNYRIAKHFQPNRVLETHGGHGLSTELYKLAGIKNIISCRDWKKEMPDVKPSSCELIDIDPFGWPYPSLIPALSRLKEGGALLITNGEIQSVVRHLDNTYLKTKGYYGKEAWRWVLEIYIPYLEGMTDLKAQFFYAFPTSIRVILSATKMPKKLFKGCKRWMWWFEKYAAQNELEMG